MDHQIRTAQPSDADAISRLMAVLGYELAPDQVKQTLASYQRQSGAVLVATEDGRVVGFLSAYASPLFHQLGSLGRITAMAIDPAHFRKGIGASLVEAAEQFAMERGCLRMEVTSGDHREQDAHLFYLAQGYEPDCRRFIKRLPRLSGSA